MKNRELNIEVLDKLGEYESLDNIEPSQAWSRSLMRKIALTKRTSAGKSLKSKSAVIILLLILLNIVFMLKMISNNSRQLLNHNEDMRIISRELLIETNPLNE